MRKRVMATCGKGKEFMWGFCDLRFFHLFEHLAMDFFVVYESLNFTSLILLFEINSLPMHLMSHPGLRTRKISSLITSARYANGNVPYPRLVWKGIPVCNQQNNNSQRESIKSIETSIGKLQSQRNNYRAVLCSTTNVGPPPVSRVTTPLRGVDQMQPAIRAGGHLVRILPNSCSSVIWKTCVGKLWKGDKKNNFMYFFIKLSLKKIKDIRSNI